MTKFNQSLVVLLLFIYFNLELLGAKQINEKDGKLNIYKSFVNQPDDELILAYASIHSLEAAFYTGRSTAIKFSASLKKLDGFSKSEIEEDNITEKWMSNINDDLWLTNDIEEELKLESWMFMPCNWLNKSEKHSLKSSSEPCPRNK